MLAVHFGKSPNSLCNASIIFIYWGLFNIIRLYVNVILYDIWHVLQYIHVKYQVFYQLCNEPLWMYLTIWKIIYKPKYMTFTHFLLYYVLLTMLYIFLTEFMMLGKILQYILKCKCTYNFWWILQYFTLFIRIKDDDHELGKFMSWYY